MKLDKPYNRLRYLVLLLMLGLVYMSGPVAASGENARDQQDSLYQSIIHGLDYISVDYPAVVDQGKVQDKEEYAEQIEIAGHVLSQVRSLPQNSKKAVLIQQVQSLLNAIDKKAPGIEVASLSRNTIDLFIASYQVRTAPAVLPTLSKGRQLFQENCTACHGLTGMGDGVQAALLTPRPANFHDRSRQQYRNLHSLFNTISLGVDETPMPSFMRLSVADRWALAFYVGQFYASDAEVQKGEQLWTSREGSTKQLVDAFTGIQQLTQAIPADVEARWGQDGLALLAYLRTNPQVLQQVMTSPLDTSRNYLAASIAAYQSGNTKEAYEKALAAYFEGFELIEARLKTVAPELRIETETAMMQYRAMIKERAGIVDTRARYLSLSALLDEVDEKLTVSSASSSVNFVTSMLILLREGLEAILVVAAIVAVLIKANRRDAILYIHAGWIGALVLGFITWYAASHFITLSGAQRELTEGVAALIAAGMLFYVGFWLHNQSQAAKWQKFVREKIASSLSAGALWGLALMAFLAVYREVFESVLFYQSLMLNSEPAQQTVIMAGIGVAAGLLVLLAWLIMRFSVRLPLKAFFKVNMLLMFLLAVVFAGKGVAALQEGSVFPVDPVNFPRIELLGIYPNMESLGLQLAMISIAVLWGAFSYLKTNRKQIA
ncbi:cytochrome c/FTR1 family iron permease [Kaarinaea lacus]